MDSMAWRSEKIQIKLWVSGITDTLRTLGFQLDQDPPSHTLLAIKNDSEEELLAHYLPSSAYYWIMIIFHPAYQPIGQASISD